MKLLFSKTNFVFTYKLSKEYKSNDGYRNLTIRNHYIIVIDQYIPPCSRTFRGKIAVIRIIDFK